jgi:hypothetical protein
MLHVHIVALVLGGLAAAGMVLSALETASYDALAVALSKVTLAAFLVTITLGFVATLVVRGFTPAAPLLYVLSLVLGGVVVGASAHSMAKGFAPFDPHLLDYVRATALIVIGYGLAIAAAVATFRWSRFPLF